MTKDILKQRTKDFALRAINLVDALPRRMSADVIGRQLLRSATSVGANYRSACRGRSEAEFAAKLGIVIEEADESAYWLELVVASGFMQPARVEDLCIEAGELTAIFTAAVQTTRRKSAQKHRVPTESGISNPKS